MHTINFLVIVFVIIARFVRHRLKADYLVSNKSYSIYSGIIKTHFKLTSTTLSEYARGMNKNRKTFGLHAFSEYEPHKEAQVGSTKNLHSYAYIAIDLFCMERYSHRQTD